MSFTDYLENKVLDHVWGSVAYAAPANLYVGLSTTAPADDGSNITEPPGANGYARVQTPNDLTNWPAASAGVKQNGTEVQFPTATGSWGTVTYFFISDAAVGGNIIGSGSLTTPKTVDNGDTVSFAIGDLSITLD